METVALSWYMGYRKCLDLSGKGGGIGMERLSTGAAEVTGLAAPSSLVKVQGQAVDEESNRRRAPCGNQVWSWAPDSRDCLFID